MNKGKRAGKRNTNTNIPSCTCLLEKQKLSLIFEDNFINFHLIASLLDSN
jgi:hypothetical protein